jgi:hypothetical protein
MQPVKPVSSPVDKVPAYVAIFAALIVIIGGLILIKVRSFAAMGGGSMPNMVRRRSRRWARWLPTRA